jgi:hypothetical protein
MIARKTFSDNNLPFIAPKQCGSAYQPKYKLDTLASPTLYQVGLGQRSHRYTDAASTSQAWRSQSEGRRTMASQLISLPFIPTVV